MLIAEVDLNTACVLDRDAVSINSMAQETLGETGATAASAVFLFLHYCLLTAYVVQGGQLLGEALGGADTFVAAPAFAASIGAPAALSGRHVRGPGLARPHRRTAPASALPALRRAAGPQSGV